MTRDDNRLLKRCGKLVPAAPGMMVCNALLPVGRTLVAIPLVVTGGLGRRRNAIDLLGGMGQPARPQHQEEHKRSDQDLPASHQGRP